MSDANVLEVVKFLETFRTRKEIEENFGLSNTQSYNLIRWLLKGGYIEEYKVRLPDVDEFNSTNRVWVYIRKESKKP